MDLVRDFVRIRITCTNLNPHLRAQTVMSDFDV